MNLGTAQVIRADARNLPLADNSVDLVVTSPPYFALRSYQDGGETYAGQIGSEPTPAEFVAALLEVTRECVRVLKPSGSLWVNLGDKYAGSDGTPGGASSSTLVGQKRAHAAATGRAPKTDVRAKSLIAIPWRYALACIDDLGLILRAEVIWSKPNGLPESVTDRVRRSHEQWFHFTLEPRYFSAVDEIREEHAARLHRPGSVAGNPDRSERPEDLERIWGNPLGKLPGSVWTVPTEPLRVPDHLGIDHFAAFPTAWPKRIIQGWSPAGVCVACGEGRRPVVHRPTTGEDNNPDDRKAIRVNDGMGGTAFRKMKEAAGGDRITGYACDCSCNCEKDEFYGEDFPHRHDCLTITPAPTTPAVVLDPFGGTGTTAMVAKALGRHGISVDMSADYCRLAEWRTNDRDQLAKVLDIEKAGPVDDDQLDLFGEEIA